MPDSNVIEMTFGDTLASQVATEGNINALKCWLSELRDVYGPEAATNMTMEALGRTLTGVEMKKMPKTAAMVEAFAQRLK